MFVISGPRYRFDNFELDPVERRLFAGEKTVELNSRYFDAILLLFGQPPGDVTGAFEGLLLGAAVGLGDDLGRTSGDQWNWRRCCARAALLGAVAGVAIELSGGQLFGGSLRALAESFPDARLQWDPLGRPPEALSAMLTSPLEGAWFCACLVGALGVARLTWLAPRACH